LKNIAVFGLGFVGLPLALSFARKDCRVFGVDIDSNLVDELNNGITFHLESYQGQSVQDILQNELQAGRFKAYSDSAEAMKNCDYIIITVGIPIENGDYNLDPLIQVCKSVGQGLKKGDLVLMRSTVIPGTTRRLTTVLERDSGLKAGRDFFLAYSSERIAEGKAFEEFENMPAVLAGINNDSAQRAKELMSIVTKAPITLGSKMEAVEVAKVMENVSRDVNIAMANEFARFCKVMGLDIFEVIKLANTHQRVNLLTPGAGVGGYCIPNALYYLLPVAREKGLDLSLLSRARQINDEMAQHVANMVLANLPVPPNKAKIAVLGLAMKDYSNDDRVSPALRVVENLLDTGCEVRVYDPAVHNQYWFKVDQFEQALTGAHLLLVLVLQKDIDYMNLEWFRSLMCQDVQAVIVDIKNLYKSDLAERYGFRLEKL